MNGDVAEQRLRVRYRRLLAWYPAGHRERYGEEILGALLAASTPGQVRPDRREALDLVVSGLGLRFAAVFGGGPALAARSAASVFGLVVSVALAALSWHLVAFSLAPPTLGGSLDVGLPVSYRAVAMGVGWTSIAVAGVLGLRRVAALGAVVGLAGETAVLARQYAEAPAWVVWSWWLLTLIAVTTAGLVAAIAPARDAIPGRSGALEGEPAGGGGWRRILHRDPAPLGRRPVVALAAGAVLMLVEPFVAEALMVVHRTPSGWTVSERLPFLSAPSVSTLTDSEVQAGTILAVISVVVVLRLRPAVRRRVVLLAAPVAVTFGLIRVGFEGFMASSPRFNPPVYLAAGQWSALTLTPLMVFAFGAWLLRRYEGKLASGALLSGQNT